MAITTIDLALAGMQPPVEWMKPLSGTLVVGQPRNLMYLAGLPGAAVAPAPGIGGAVLTSAAGVSGYPGCLPFPATVGGKNIHLGRFQMAGTTAGTFWLCDRLWHNSGMDVTSTSEQTFTAAAQIPARDADGTNNGRGVYFALEASANMGAGTPTVTVKYTNSGGTPDKSLAAANIVPIAASSLQGTFIPMALAAGDVGIQIPQSMTLSATMTSGSLSAVLYRVLAKLEVGLAGVPNAIDALTAGMPRAYDGTTPFVVFVPSATTTSATQGHVIFTQN